MGDILPSLKLLVLVPWWLKVGERFMAGTTTRSLATSGERKGAL